MTETIENSAPMTDAYEAMYNTRWLSTAELYNTRWLSTAECYQIMWRNAWNAAMKKAIHTVETYSVSVGNSAAGERAAEWTMQNLAEIREDLREMVVRGIGTK